MNVGGPLKGDDCVDSATLHRSVNTDDALRNLMYLTIYRLRSPILNCNIRLEDKKPSELLLYVPENVQTSQVFEDIPYSVTVVVNVTQPSPP